MIKNFYYLNRIIDKKVMASLSLLIFNNDLNSINENSKDFKDFIQTAYSVKREDRPSVSQLSDIFRKYNCKMPGTLACMYAKRLEAMAQLDSNINFWV